MSTAYRIDITLSGPDITTLQNEGWSLYAFKAVKTTAGGTEPVLWFKTDKFMQTTHVNWTEQYQAYVSRSDIIPNGEIDAETESDIDLGQKATVDANGNLSLSSDGQTDVVSLSNPVKGTQWTSGLAQMSGTDSVPMCALTLHGNSLELIAPIEKVLLIFATKKFNTGQVVYQSFSDGVMIDLTTAPADAQGAKTRAVQYVVNVGWSWNAQVWGTAVAAQDDLGPLLIDYDSGIAKKAQLMRHLAA